MDDGLKQRLVGAAVLAALGVIFLPVLFDSEQRRRVDRTSQIPPAPTIAPLKISEPQRNPDIEAVKPATEMYTLLPEEDAQPDPAATTTASLPQTSEKKPSQQQPAPVADRKVLDKHGVPKAWAVQVASFTTEKRARVLRDQLLEDNYPAFTRTLSTTKGVVTRVYVGPKLNRDKARSLKSTLDKELSVNTLVVRFSPSASSK